jgi:hypothetical protein
LGKIEIVPPLERTEFLLLVWSDWVKRGGKFERGYPPRSSVFAEVGKNSVEDMEDSNERYIARAVDTIVYKDLPKEESSAIQHQYLGKEYKGLIVFYSPTLKRAKEMAKKLFVKKGIW